MEIGTDSKDAKLDHFAKVLPPNGVFYPVVLLSLLFLFICSDTVMSSS